MSDYQLKLITSDMYICTICICASLEAWGAVMFLSMSFILQFVRLLMMEEK